MSNNTFVAWAYVNYLFQFIKIIKLLFTSFFDFGFGNIKKTELIIKSPTDIYTDKHLTVFMNSFENSFENGLEKNEKNEKNWNLNIDPVFYNKEKYLELLKDEDNVLEKEWKKRILIEYTPRGNVFMFYDPYKLGFSYYCDQYVPYNILNSVAMKYVLKFQCLDFFMDEVVVPENSPLPLLNLIIEEKKAKEIEEKNDSNSSNSSNNIKNRLRNAPFAKFKNYNRANVQNNSEETKKEPSVNVPPEKQKERNKFINLGKTMNFSILQPVMKKKRYSNMFKSKLANSLFDNSSVQKEVFSYRDFKSREVGKPCGKPTVSPHAPSLHN